MTQSGQSVTHIPAATEPLTGELYAAAAAVAQESTERWAIIELLAGHIADDETCDCHGEGLDYEGDEWTLCECVLTKVQR